jgi:hypothetical protein
MDFIRKKSDAGTGGEGFNFDASNTDLGNNAAFPNAPNSPQMNYQPEGNLSPSMNLSSMGNTAFGQSSMQQPAQGPDIEKDLQMISLKLDAIKSEVDAMSQRLKNLESIAEREQSKSTNKKWY